MYDISIGPVLKRLMRERDLSLIKIHRGTGIPYSTLHTWQENRPPKKLELVQALADFLEISLSDLLFDFPKKRITNLDPLPNESCVGRFTEGEYHVIVRRIK